MSSTCCSSGKARVFYNIPTQGGLKYKLKNSTKWRTMLVDEKVTHECVAFSGTTVNWACSSGETGETTFNYPVSIDEVVGGTRVSGFYVLLGTRTDTGGGVSVDTRCDRFGPAPNYFLSGNSRYKFTVTGTETGTKYLEIEVDECPDVQTIPCKFDPAKEQFIDVEMIPYTELPIPLPNYPIFQDCIEITRVGNFTVVEKVTKRNYGPKGDSDPTVRETKTILLVLDSAENCPPPQVRVECCPKGICGEDKKCPKGTTCELICNGFKCCYSKGVLIRSIKL